MDHFTFYVPSLVLKVVRLNGSDQFELESLSSTNRINFIIGRTITKGKVFSWNSHLSTHSVFLEVWSQQYYIIIYCLFKKCVLLLLFILGVESYFLIQLAGKVFRGFHQEEALIFLKVGLVILIEGQVELLMPECVVRRLYLVVC